ncbi:MAG: sigma 54-interacting transcriptional regulator [Myxococcota bacterium]
MTDPKNDTLVEDESQDGNGAQRAWLISIGSPEDNFAHAARVFSLDVDQRVKFRRDDDSEELRYFDDGATKEVGIPFGWVSGEHAELEVSPRARGLGFSLRDLGSRNGTLVNGERISGSVKLRPGDVFEVGRSFWTVRAIRGSLSMPKSNEFDPVGTCSPHLHQIHRTLKRLAPSTLPILMRGETGTGKEYLARAIHRVSGRPGPFVVANLAAMSENRVEALLFGDGDRPGLFDQANGGTLMLDELGELSAPVQSKLLSALTEGGASSQGRSPVDVRLVASTLQDLGQRVEAGDFRPDLYSRLAGFVAELPPVRARREDLGLLCRTFVRQMQRDGRPTRLTSNAFRRILGRAWPFNVRQLTQTITTASLLASGDGTITADALAEILEQDDGLPQSPDEVRRIRADLVRHLAKFHGDTDGIASAMGRDPYQIQRWLERFELQPESYQS